ncbi:uncharacterized protein BCR38DRAFT_29979 [Pseudomassariella vexata]|uniref:Uncharacterized protein n=1 Tax=Pseudomassariella vexata TaxID=1141098 RepID=A0A1Y2DPM1_9PEZI|nr:uncharacterized protein BCR38DRAFT_29979 [Pseudomassariella vexata]ORY61231.1 hypothetical protein BCR38DRAFT_29979 [Pseudomassariella vexata]
MKEPAFLSQAHLVQFKAHSRVNLLLTLVKFSTPLLCNDSSGSRHIQAGGNFPPPSAFAPGQIPIPGPYGTFPPPGSFAPLQGHFLGQPGFPAPGQYQPNLHGQMSPSGLYDSGLSNPQVLSELVQNQPSSQESQADLYASGIHQQASPTVVTGQSSEHNGQNQLPQPQMGSAPQGQCLGLDTYRYATLAQAEADFDAELYAWMNGNAATEEPQANVQADRGSNVTDPTEPIGRDIDGLKKIIEGDRDALTAARRDVAAGNLTGLEAQALEVFEQNAEAETTAERDWVAQTIAERDLETLQLARLSLSDDASKIAEKALAGAMDESLLASQVERAQATSKGDKEQANEAEQAQTDSMRDSELAAVAGQLLANVEDNTSEKFKNSKFLELMRRLQSQEVVAHDNDFVEASSVPALAPRSGLAPTSSVGSHVTGSRTGPPLTLQQNPGQQASSPVTPKTVTVKDVDEGQDEK